ncbi:MAG: SIMPL domain-containing protein [Armatimonadota bacterium]
MKGKVLLSLCVVCIAGTVLAQRTKPPTDTILSQAPIQVTATGEAYAMPDQAVVSFTVRAEENSRMSARRAVRQLSERVLEGLTQMGVNRSLVKADGLSISEVTQPVGGGSNDAKRPRQYSASETYTLTMPINETQLDELLRIVELLEPSTGIGEGGITVVSVRLRLRNLDQLIQRATSEAVARARKIAEAAAQQDGKRSVRLLCVIVTNISFLPQAHGDYSIRWQPERVFVQVSAGFDMQ